jgi:sarcosine oxidase/L-pipecolate oxidase
MESAKPSDKILIVGAGVFGLSTAYHLLQRDFSDITIIDRSTTLPAPDAAGTDLNKGLRSYLVVSIVTTDRFFVTNSR